MTDIKHRNILISGAGIAGPTLAYWLKRYGFNPTIVERASGLREGGQAIDIQNESYAVAHQMGLLPQLQAASTEMEGLAFVSGDGRRRRWFNVRALREIVGSGWLEVPRSDLSKILYDATKDNVEYIFGDSIAAIQEDNEGVEVTFESGSRRRFDLVVGADGLHSVVRKLVFGDEAQFERYLGYYVGVFSTDNTLKLDHQAVTYNVPGKNVSVTSAKDSRKALVYLVFKQDEKLEVDYRDTNRQKEVLSAAFADLGWEVPGLLEKMHSAPDFYFDAVSQIQMEPWSRGRVVLLGDAGYCPSLLSGQGSGLAMVGAYVLAGELKAAAGDYASAFKGYEKEFKPLVEKGQRRAGSGAKFLIPETPFGIGMRNALFQLFSLVMATGALWKRLIPAPKPAALKHYAEA
jgi:2-polyprenyl-6-methoxyphenol hydroxylase-like FAD-dependent oxidoreductase